MRIERLELKNWMRFRGATDLALGARHYAIIAESEGEPGRSNWLGKSSLVGAIRFALFGVLPEAMSVTDWISHGETSGLVRITFSDGATIERSRTTKRGDVIVRLPGADEASGDAAELAIEKYLAGTSYRSACSTWWIGQKQAAAFLAMDPEDRMRAISSWLDLTALERCAKIVRTEMAELAAEDAKLSSQLEQLGVALEGAERVMTAALERGGPEKLADEARTLTTELEAADAEIERFAAETQAAQTARAAFDRVVAEGKAKRAELERLPRVDAGAVAENEQAYKADAEALAVLENDVRRAVSRCRDGFDGACPAAAGFSCPVPGEVDQVNARNAKALEADKARATARRAEVREFREEIDQALGVARKREALERELVSLRTQAERLQRDAAASMSDQAYATASAEIEQKRAARFDGRRRLQAIAVEQEQITKTRHELEALVRSRGTITTKLGDIRKRRALLLVASKLYGRNGAQRRVAENDLLSVEDGANEALREAGIDLRIELQWSREGKTKATTCEDCGAAFGRSNECPGCSAPRGPAIIQQLRMKLSDRSGAAEDLAGVTFQLAAARRLRERHDGGISFAVLDEPFGALDVVHRRSLALVLPKVLAAAGLDQSFTIAHSPDVLEALPGRILIKGDGKWSTASVVAR